MIRVYSFVKETDFQIGLQAKKQRNGQDKVKHKNIEIAMLMPDKVKLSQKH